MIKSSRSLHAHIIFKFIILYLLLKCVSVLEIMQKKVYVLKTYSHI